MYRFHYKYFILSVLLFLTEVSIAWFNPNNFIRYFLGDVLIVILLYTSVKTIFISNDRFIALAVLAFSYILEVFQYFNGINLIGLENNSLVKIIIGTTFSFSDLVAYSIGFGIIIISEKINPYHLHNPVDKKTFW